MLVYSSSVVYPKLKKTKKYSSKAANERLADRFDIFDKLIAKKQEKWPGCAMSYAQLFDLIKKVHGSDFFSGERESDEEISGMPPGFQGFKRAKKPLESLASPLTSGSGASAPEV
jgi:hypothetical protein